MLRVAAARVGATRRERVITRLGRRSLGRAGNHAQIVRRFARGRNARCRTQRARSGRSRRCRRGDGLHDRRIGTVVPFVLVLVRRPVHLLVQIRLHKLACKVTINTC